MATTTINVTNQLQDLQSVTDEGNITTNDINLDNSAIILENSSRLQSGTIDNGAGGGIARVCSIGYQDEWENGIQYFIEQNSGQIIRANSINNTIPGINHDITMGYIPGSIFHDMNNQNKYKCTDNTDGAAVWVPFFETPQPTTNYGLYTQTSSSTPVTNTTTETSLLDGGVGSLTVPANGFSVGDSFHAILTGHISSVNNHTLTLRIKSGSVVLATTGAITMATTTTKHWKLEIYFTVRQLGASGVASIASGGSFIYTKNASNNLEGINFSTETTSGFDTTISNTLSITAQWGTANAGDSIYSEIFTLNKTY
jgi:hypothetical protein